MPMDVPSIVGHGWRQGSLFTLEASQALLGEKRTHANSRLILASQDCDIVHRGNGEPFVDTFEAKPILALVPTESRQVAGCPWLNNLAKLFQQKA
jgi:hypothetical protein